MDEIKDIRAVLDNLVELDRLEASLHRAFIELATKICNGLAEIVKEQDNEKDEKTFE